MNEHAHRRATRFAWVYALLLVAVVASCAPAHAASPVRASAGTKTWSVSRDGSVLQIGYGSGVDFPQYAALHLRSSFFRMVYSRAAGWGTSVILLPALWSKASCPTDYCQGAPVTASWRKSGADLVLSIHGTIATLKVAATVTLTPPAKKTLVAHVSTKVTGTIKLDKRPGEAFKPVMLSSMHDSSTLWDSRTAFIRTRVRRFPPSGWIIHPPVTTRNFGLRGGTSSFKNNAPTVEVTLKQRRPVTGWLKRMNPPNTNKDNVGFWCAANKVLPSWSFSVTAEPGNRL